MAFACKVVAALVSHLLLEVFKVAFASRCVEGFVKLVTYFAVVLEDFVLLAEGHVTYGIPFCLEVLHHLNIGAACFNEGFELFDDGILLREVVIFFLAHTYVRLALLFEEVVARIVEALPNHFRTLVGSGTNSLPFLLEFYEDVGSLRPIGIVLEGFSLFAEGRLCRKVACVRITNATEVFRL